MARRRPSRCPVYDQPRPALEVVSEHLNIDTEAARDLLVALVEAGYGIAPRNPTNGMLAAYMGVPQAPTGHESVLTAIGKARGRWQAMLEEGIAMAMSTKRLDKTAP